MSQVDFKLVRRCIADAARRTFEGVRTTHPDETFYAYALYSFDDACGVNPSMNSEQAFQRDCERVKADKKQQQWLESQGIPLSVFLLGEYRWSPFNWEYECPKPDYFQGMYDLLHIEPGLPNYDEEEPLGFEYFKANVFAAMILALGDLNAEGFFGSGRERERVTVFCSVPASGHAY